MNTFLDGLRNEIQGDLLGQLSNQIGADPAATANALELALPVLLGGLARNAQDPQGAQSLDNALNQDHDGSLLDNLGALFGQGGMLDTRALDGAGILEHILGSRRSPVEDGIERSTGLNGTQVAQLLALLAPIVMSYLGKRKRADGLDAGGLGDVFRQEQREAAQQSPGLGGLLTQVLDRDDDGSVSDDIARMAPGVLGALFGRRG